MPFTNYSRPIVGLAVILVVVAILVGRCHSNGDALGSVQRDAGNHGPESSSERVWPLAAPDAQAALSIQPRAPLSDGLVVSGESHPDPASVNPGTDALVDLVRQQRAAIKPMKVGHSVVQLQGNPQFNPRRLQLTEQQCRALSDLIERSTEALQGIENRRHELSWSAYEEAALRGRFITLALEQSRSVSTEKAEAMLKERLGLDRRDFSYVFLSNAAVGSVAIYFTRADAPEYFQQTRDGEVLFGDYLSSVRQFFAQL